MEEKEAVEKRAGILFIGSPHVGKRTLISRLLSVNCEDAFDSSNELLVQGWTIDTKYYTADVAIWMSHLHDEFATCSLPNLPQLAALVMVFDMSELSSLAALKKWVSQTDIQSFDILLCIGNKVDLVPGHPAHEEYRRHLRRNEDSFVGSDVDLDYGISETDGSSLLHDEEPSCDVSRSCLEWCMEHNIEFVEACASNVDFDKSLSVNGDSQGVERLLGALSAHMWPGMVLKSGSKILAPMLPERQESSEEESDYEADYEILSKGSVELWDDTEEGWVSALGPGSSSHPAQTTEDERIELSASASFVEAAEHKTVAEINRGEPSALAGSRCTEEEGNVVYKDDIRNGDGPDEGAHLELEDLEQIMSEIANMRSSSRLMPDFQRREMAAKLAMKMAAMFGDSSGDEGYE